VGKIYELSYERGFHYTTDGQLLGHISIAMRLVGDALAKLPDFPSKLRTLVEHMILSHHGRLEFGSPKVPQFPEALLLHYLDDLDSKMECMRTLVDRDRLVDGVFTGYSVSMERSILKKGKYLDEEPPTPAASEVPKASAPIQAEPVRPASVFAGKLLQALGAEPSKEADA
jgi:3'-5' exoribonuclease